jgi:hypothetical protein
MLAVALTFPPLVKGGPGGGGPQNLRIVIVFAVRGGNDVLKRHAMQAGEAANTPSTSSIDRAKHTSIVHSTLIGPPPLAPPSQEGKR